MAGAEGTEKGISMEYLESVLEERRSGRHKSPVDYRDLNAFGRIDGKERSSDSKKRSEKKIEKKEKKEKPTKNPSGDLGISVGVSIEAKGDKVKKGMEKPVKNLVDEFLTSGGVSPLDRKRSNESDDKMDAASEKEALRRKLEELDRKAERLREEKELEVMRREVEERQRVVAELEDSVKELGKRPKVKAGRAKNSKSDTREATALPGISKSKGDTGGGEFRQLRQELQTSNAAAFAQDIKVHILSDSIAKHLTGIRRVKVMAFPGINISRLTSKIQREPFLVSRPFTILHVGTNDINSLSEDEFISDYNNLIAVVKRVSNTTLLVSSVLPRPVDYENTGDTVKEVNKKLKQLCGESYVRFLHSFRPFFKCGQPIRKLFAVRDGGLHLNTDGQNKLCSFFINTVAHL